MSETAVFDGGVLVEGRSRTVSTFLDCLHPSVYRSSDGGAESAGVRRCIGVISTLLTNHRQHPNDPRYASFSAVSSAWQGGVLPWVYVLRLVAWMGCTPNTEGSRYIFQDCSSAADHLRVLDDCIEELRCVMAVWCTPVSSLATSTDQEAFKEESSGRGGMTAAFSIQERTECFEAARASLTEKYTIEAMISPPTEREEAFRSCTSALQLKLLSLASCAMANSTGTQRGVRAARPPLLSTKSTPVDACLRRDSIQWLLQHTSLCELTQECQRAAALVAAAAAASGTTSYFLPDPRGSASLSVARPSSAMVQRLRNRAREEQHQRYLNTTGPAYRALTQEERHRGESAVIDIAGVLEQIAVVTETQGMVRADRQEARRLLDAFKQDGDLAKLYALQEQYTAALEEAKKSYGKPLVYGEYESLAP
ncbi:hypothetical protein ABB37_05354 [Leptomonas pyrrhocoris]|uniref:PUB domain-containing protein n=1 Tax=Leptomonas pyrrhocoris TaxID=157538 RepID=A0A0N0DUW8_LEPPY|nr:hypothetical protein ABB37_05354 [Leptomonas pyrrhocoris]XP_015657974.1 hypothetical protein ABB37_05354 [Leptomonas pyrrhocoris]XP_015657975.1 hypothetical protein ABB37_05354 [Leptomonas pyrrhocoris]KPA79534.1 hypothetical protein ABB37_05354 [Leptomonas pyrrhocoris]KPA79535.1 hypothetical protein ABB37_05354 [Leptomonas pyrrhocoris]KPA79536.1 hypothetical protein ABB37_05354 [Leptomonas pyrrhocoris]|eukprot:XP_015657973.1 hypothetical protein ABB37_05354 [Leptomonas pyrrhocoris]